MASKAELLIAKLEPIAEANGLELVTVEIAGTNKNPILRVYLDTPAGGIDLDQLVMAREWVDATVEELDPFAYSYMLEVSSPGIDRPLRKPADYEKYAGEDVVVHLKKGEPKTKVKGVLKGFDEGAVVVEANEEEERIDIERIKKANIIGKIDFKSSKKQD